MDASRNVNKEINVGTCIYMEKLVMVKVGKSY